MSIVISARPAALDIDPKHAAVIVVDMQNDFGSDGGMFDRAGIDISSIKAIVPAIAQVLAAARLAAIPVIYLKMQYGSDLAKLGGPRAPNFIKHRRLGVGEVVLTPGGNAGRILVQDTWNTAIVDDLSPHDNDFVVEKHRFSGFFETKLDALLRSMQIETLVVTGATTSVCVDSTVRDAMFRDYRCLVLSDCVAEPLALNTSRSNHEASLLTFEALLGWVADSSALIAALSPAREAAE